MRKHFLQSLLVVVLSVIGVSQCWADNPYYYPFTFVGTKTGCCGINDNQSISYNGLNNSTYAGSEIIHLHEGAGDGYQIHLPNCEYGYKTGFIMLTSYTHSVAPYTKVTLTYNYSLGCFASNLWASSSLYKFDDETTAKSTAVDFTDGFYNNAGKDYLFATYTKKTSDWDWRTTIGTTYFYFDNLAGTNTQSISKYITLAFCVGNGGNDVGEGYFNGTFKCTSYSFTYTYRKIITFDGNGNTGGSMSNQNIDNSGNLTTNAFTRDGYTFTGWNTKADGTGTTYTDGEFITVTKEDKGPVTLYAKWKRAGSEDAQSVVFTPTKCKGYQQNSNYQWINFSNLDLESSSDWLQSGGGFADIKTLSANSSSYEECIQRYNIGTWAGELFDWFTMTYTVPSYASIKFTTVYQVAVSQVSDLSGKSSVRAAYFDYGTDANAYWSGGVKDPLNYSNFHTSEGQNGDNGSTAKGTVTFQGESVAAWIWQATSHSNIVSKEVIVNNSNGTNTKSETHYCGFSSSKCPTAENKGGGHTSKLNIKYAYSIDYYKYITFNGNSSTGGSMAQQTILNSGNLTANAFTRGGYTFIGWNTKADGTGTAYANGAAITATATDKGPVTLYAQWKRTVTIDKQDGTSTTTIEVNCNSTYNTLPADPTRTGYTFKGWFDAQTGGTQYTKTTASTNDIPATLYAQWNAIDYTITYNVNGGSEITEHKTYTIETATFNLPKPTKDGYTFGGWFTNEGCTEGLTTQIAQGSTGNKEFFAQWNAIDYTITYNVNGGSEVTEHKTYTIETATFDLPKPTKDGYTFGGWFTNEGCTEGLTTQIAQGSTGNKEFYAQWSENVISDGTDKDNVNDAATEVNTTLNIWLEECEGSKAINLTINRTIYKDGYYNTLCLPFDMSATQITETFGEYKELKQFQSATVQGSGDNRSIVIEVEDATTIEAGKAYLISFEKGTDLTSLTFNEVVVSTVEATDESGTLAYQGILAPYQLPYNNQDYLFLGENNTLYWAIDDGTFMKGFRAYFKVNTNPAQAPYRVGMRAAFGGRQTPTDLSPVVSGQEVRKLLEQGRVVIVNKGVKYNMNGATVQ